MKPTHEPACREHVQAGRDYWHEPPGREAPEDANERILTAKAICLTCPLLAACGEAAHASGETEWGIWAGRLPSERNLSDWPACTDARGTVKGYSRHRRAREPVCDDCRTAWNLAKKDREDAA